MADHPRQSMRQEQKERHVCPPSPFSCAPRILGVLLVLLTPALSPLSPALGQTTVPFPSTSPIPSSSPPTYPTAPTTTYPPNTYPPPTFPTTTSPTTVYPTTTYPPSTVNPYAPSFRDSTAPVPQGYPPGTIPLGPAPTGMAPTGTYPYGMPPSTFGSPVYPSSVYPNSQPPVMYPGTTAPNPYFGYPPGTYPPPNNWWTTTTMAVQTQAQETIRLCQGARFRTTYLPGTTDFSSPGLDDLESTDFETSLVFACPKFLGCSQPLYLIPSYTQTLWGGPTNPGVDVPGNAFGAFLDATWETDPAQTFGAELGVRVGVFSSFDAISSQSVRVPVKALGRLRLTPNSTARLGVYYIDRWDVKLLPALGVLWVPNPDTRWDIFFPEPKLSHYLTTHGNKDVWWYVTGYYGGGAWTIEYPDGADDRMDINDIRVLVGFECGQNELLRQGFRSYFFEIGYAFDRQLLFVNNPQNNIDLGESLVFRAGFGY